MTTLALILLGALAQAADDTGSKRLKGDWGVDPRVEQRLKEGELADPVPAAANAYFLCLAVASGDDSACAALASIPALGADQPFHDSTALCRTFYRHAAMSKALISRDPSARRQCLRWGPGAEQHMLPPAFNEVQCDLLMSMDKDPAGGCEKAVRFGVERPRDRAVCERTAGAHWGLAPPCEETAPDPLASPHLREWCMASNAAGAFRKARAAGSADSCGGDGLCRAMMGAGPNSCRGYAAKVLAVQKGFRPGMDPPPISKAPEPEKEEKHSAEPAPAIAWIAIPGGSFMMGDKPGHRVTVGTFQMAKTLVTNRQYRACVSAGGCAPALGLKGFDGDEQPVTGVDWRQASAFSRWAGGRLPSEAEWEYAARGGGKDREYPWGDEPPTCARAIIADCADATAPVCSRPEGNTEQGLCDMAGNAWEWVQDWYHDSYAGAPDDGSAWESPPGAVRVIRGGSWRYGAPLARAALRYYLFPAFGYIGISFRPVR